MNTQYTFQKGATGCVTATSAAIDVDCGFIPRLIWLVNVGSGFALMSMWMSDVPDSTSTITILNSDDSVQGFRIGTDPELNFIGNTIMWIAWG